MAHQSRESFDLGWKFKLADEELLKTYEHWLLTGAFNEGAPAFNFNDAKWETVNLPHDFVVSGNFTNKDPYSTVDPQNNPLLWSGSLPGGVGWYRKRFQLPENEQDQRVYLFFDGVFRDSRFYLNQCYLGSHKSGYTSFYFDITDLAQFGEENLLAVRVDATSPEGWFYEGGGIYRHAWLVKTEPVHIAPWGTFITYEVDITGDHPSAVVHIRTTLVNKTLQPLACKLTSTLIDPNQQPVGEVSSDVSLSTWGQVEESQYVQIDGPTLWSIDHPNLYQVVSTIRVNDEIQDSYTTTIGIRSTRFDADQGFFLNEQPLKIKGVCCHQDHAGVGVALPDGLLEYRIRKLKEMGCNAYRSAHNPPTPELLDACDRLGMLVMDENRRLSSAPEDLADLEALVRRDRNHPSVILWSIGNEEVAIQMKPQARRIARSLVALVHKLDRSRPVTLATTFWNPANNTPAAMEPIPFPSTGLDVMGFNYNPDYWEPFHLKFPAQPIVVSEASSNMRTRGCYGSDDPRCFLAWDDPRAQSRAEMQWAKVAQSPYLSGIFLWTGFDYRGEPYPQGWPGISSNFGILDTCGFPKDNYYYYQAAWKAEPLVHIFPHWNVPDRVGQPITVGCYSNCEEVELFLNSKSLGRQKMEPASHLEWKNVIYIPGVLEAKGYRGGLPVTAARVETTGAPYALHLVPDQASLVEEHDNIIVVNVEVVDEHGRVVPTADNEVSFHVDAPAKVIGVGNGCPSSHEADHASYRRAFNGYCQVILQMSGEEGSISLTSTAPGLLQDRISVHKSINHQ